jgi:aerobic carbon-monoxide dehydrogenase medium subunit
MLSSEFEFFAPSELGEALRLVSEHGEGAKVLAGGMSMVPAMNLGILRPSVVISLNHVAGLDYVEDSGQHLRIGAMVRHGGVVSNPLVRTHAPVLASAASHIADVQIRHRGTIGGSVAHADPAADYLPVLVAMDASVKVASTRGERTIKARDFFVDVMMTALEPGEIVVEIQVPKLAATAASAYVRLVRVEGSFAIVNAAAVVNGGRPMIAIGGATPTPVLVEPSVDLRGGISEGALEAISNDAYAATEDAYGDLSGSADYRRAMARVYAKRAVSEALATKG